MSANKKFGLIGIFTVLIPLILSYVNWKYSSYYIFQWGYEHINEISIISLLIAIFGCGLILFLNNKQQKSRSWKIASIIFIVIFAIYIYVINSLSRFGF